MTEDDSEKPAVQLGTGNAVEGAPLARVTERLMWGIEKSAVRKREGETAIRTPEGPQELGELLTDVDRQYFATRQEFEAALDDAISDGAIPVESGEETGQRDADETGEDTAEEADESLSEEADEPAADEEAGEEPADTSSATADGTPESTTDEEDSITEEDTDAERDTDTVTDGNQS